MQKLLSDRNTCIESFMVLHVYEWLHMLSVLNFLVCAKLRQYMYVLMGHYCMLTRASLHKFVKIIFQFHTLENVFIMTVV